MNEHARQSADPPFDEVADRFVEELRAGKRPSIASYREKYPQLSQQIAGLFPMLCELEIHQESSAADPGGVEPGNIPDRLGDYDIMREIGRGGMGVVYEAQHATMQRRVALKVLPVTPGDRQPLLDRFMREARAAGQLHHTNIVPVFEVGNANGIHFYAMQYIHGQNLDVVIDELRRLSRLEPDSRLSSAGVSEGTAAMTMWQGTMPGRADDDSGPPADLPDAPPAGKKRPQVDGTSEWSQIGEAGDNYFRRVARVGIQIADALEFAHDHDLLHRDIKPSNLILDTNGVVWITDFGLAKVDGDNLTHTGDIVGTLRYMAPERFEGKVDRRSDVYSLGLTLYELSTLELAFRGTDRAALIKQVMNHSPPALRSIRPEVPRDLETIIVKAMAREPSSRYPTAGQLASDLRRFVAGQPVQARRVSLAERLWRWGKRHPSRAALAVSLLLLGATIVLGSLVFGYQQRQHSRRLGVENARARKAEREARLAESVAREAEREARNSEAAALRANKASRAHLFWSHYNAGVSRRVTGTPGQRLDALNFLAEASRSLPGLDLSEPARKRRELAVRAQAIATLARWDVAEEKTLAADGDWTAVFAAEFANNRYARAGENGEISIRELHSDRQVARLQGSEHPAWITAFSPDGQCLAATHHPESDPRDSGILLWNVESGTLLLNRSERPQSGRFAFSADSRRFAVAENDGVSIYSTTDGGLVGRLEVGATPGLLRYANDDRQLLLVAEPDHIIQFWSVADGQKVLEVTAPDQVDSLDWNDANQQLVAGCERLLVIWPAGDLQAEPRELLAHGSSIRRIQLRPQGDLVFSFGWDNMTRVYDLFTLQQVLQMSARRLTHSGFSPDGSRIAFTSPAAGAGVWKLSGFRSCKVLSHPPIDKGQRVHFHPADSRIAGCFDDSSIVFRDHTRGQRIGSLDDPELTDWTFGQRGRFLYACGPQGLLRWSLTVTDEGGELKVELSDRTLLTAIPARYLQIDQTLNLAVLRQRDGQARIVSLQDGTPRVDLGPHRGMNAARVAADGRLAVTGTWQGRGVRIWDAQSGALIEDLLPDWGTTAFAFSPDGKRMITSSENQHWIWDLESRTPLLKLLREKPEGTIGSVAWSPDNRLIAAEYTSHQPGLLLPETGETVAVLEPVSPLAIRQLEFSADARYLAVASRTRIHIWDLAGTRKKLAELGMDW